MAELDTRDVSAWAMTRRMLGARLRSQVAYRGSFVGDLLSQVANGAVEFAEVYVLLHNAPVFGGMDLAQATVVYGLSCVAFGLADLVFGQLDRLDVHIRTGQLETLMVRPTPLLLQLVTSDVQLRRLGRVAFGLVLYASALAAAGVAWTPALALLAVLAPVAGAVIFGALFLLSGCLLFWVIDGGQAGNMITYGGRYVSSVPGAALFTPLRVFFTFVVPATLIAYVPAAVLTGAQLPDLLWPELAWAGLPAGVLAWVVAAWAWRAGVRRYTGAGG